MRPSQSAPLRATVADCVLMVRPDQIDFNRQTADDNPFQRELSSLSLSQIRDQAQDEFSQCVRELTAAGIEVIVLSPPPGDDIPDAVFPNNWFSTHADGTLVLYPMHAENRRRERQPDLARRFQSDFGRKLNRVFDCTHWEREQRFLEGTGSLVLDHAHRIAYAATSNRTSPSAVRQWCEQMEFQAILFETAQVVAGRQQPIYHTNVLLSIGVRWAVVCLEVIDPSDRAKVQSRLERSGRTVIELDAKQMRSFAGNILQLSSIRSASSAAAELEAASLLTVMSSTAHRALTVEQRRVISADSELIVVEIPTIEACGGGSLRCMLAEVYLPRMPQNGPT